MNSTYNDTWFCPNPDYWDMSFYEPEQPFYIRYLYIIYNSHFLRNLVLQLTVHVFFRMVYMPRLERELAVLLEQLGRLGMQNNAQADQMREVLAGLYRQNADPALLNRRRG